VLLSSHMRSPWSTQKAHTLVQVIAPTAPCRRDTPDSMRFGFERDETADVIASSGATFRWRLYDIVWLRKLATRAMLS
jgi:hypothetical protein